MKRALITLAAGLLFAAGCSTTNDPEAIYKSLNAQAEKEYLQPIRPGYEGRNPFWNKFSKKFMYAPAFDFAEVEGAVKYRFTASQEGFEKSFEDKSPKAPLSSIWSDIPVGDTRLKVVALDEKGAEIGVAGEREFFRDYPFTAPYLGKVRPYEEAAKMALLYNDGIPQIQAWKDSTEPDMTYKHNTYPDKIIGATIRNECLVARLFPEKKENALQIARNAAQFLIDQSRPEGDPLAFFPPTYYKDLIASANNQGKIMTMDPIFAGEAFLDLFDATGDELYKDRAVKIANTYKAIQREDGSYPIKMEYETGEPVNDASAMLTSLLRYLRRLEKDYGVKGFEETLAKGEKWMKEKALETFDFTGQFEDVGVDVEPYQNLTNCTAAPYASYLLRYGTEEDINDARDLIRLSEDQFVHWTSRPDANGIHHVQVPCVHEQYKYETPVDNSSCNVANAYLDLYEKTGDKLALAKAKALIDGLTIAQNQGSGFTPTTLDYRSTKRDRSRTFWINCSCSTIRIWLRMAEKGY